MTSTQPCKRPSSIDNVATVTRRMHNFCLRFSSKQTSKEKNVARFYQPAKNLRVQLQFIPSKIKILGLINAISESRLQVEKKPTNKNAEVQGTPKFIAIKCMFTTKSMKYFTVDME